MKFIKNPNEDFIRMIVEKNRVHNYPNELGSNVPQVKINVEFSEIQRARNFLDAVEAEYFNSLVLPINYTPWYSFFLFPVSHYFQLRFSLQFFEIRSIRIQLYRI